MSVNTARIQAAVVDGKAWTIRFRQRQLVNLHKAVEKARTEIVDSICKDSGHSKTEGQIQHLLTVDAIKQYYSAIDFDKCLSDEYSIANSKDHTERRLPYGYAYIIPGSYDLLYSTLVSLAAAIAAGNSIVLQLGQTTSHVSSCLHSVLRQALDNETFIIVEKHPFGADFRSQYCVQLDLQPTEKAISSSREIATPLAKTAAVVDRSSNLVKAAEEIVRSRFSFGGRSPYSPDVVLVNEFCIKDFAEAVVKHALAVTGSFQINGIANGSANGSANSSIKSNGHLTGSETAQRKPSSLKSQIEKDQSVINIASGSRGTVVLARERSSSILNSSEKVSEPILILHPITSMDDAIDYLNTTVATPTSPLLAAYLFAEPAAAKYLSQFINATASFTNSIPVELLVGPPAPNGYALVVQPRFNPDMFSTARPESITISSRNALLAKALDEDKELNKLKLGKAEKDLLDVSLKPMNEPEGGGVGFFNQGILTGGSILLSTIAATIYFSTRYLAIPLVKKGLALRG